MSCLLPQFKCQPDTFSINSKLHPSTSSLLSKHKTSVCFHVQCAVSSTTLPTLTAESSLLGREELQLPSFEANSNYLAAYRSLTYLDTVNRPTEEINLVREKLINDEEATIAAAAAEAIALARAAAKLAQDAATMTQNIHDVKSELKSQEDMIGSQNTSNLEGKGGIPSSNLLDAQSGPKESYPIHYSSISENDDPEPTEEEIGLMLSQVSEGIAVRSMRRVERKARRAKASEKAPTNVSVKLKPRKKRKAAPDVNHYDPLRYLRGTAKGSRLLTVDQELELSEGIQDLLKLEKLYEVLEERYGSEPSFDQWAATAGIDQKTLRKRLNHGIQCKDKMIKSNIRLVISIAKKYQGSGMNIQDLVQEGCRGLVRGAEKFDASKGYKFSTYAHWWIKQAVRKSLTEKSRTIRLPFRMVAATFKVRETRKQLYSENGRHPDNEEVAEAAGMSMKRLEAVLLTPRAPISLDQKIGFNENLKPAEMLSDPDAESAEDLLLKQFLKVDLEKVLNTLTPREKVVVKWRFGLVEDGRMRTLQEIGDLMGISKERIRQLEATAFRKLKSKKRSKILQQYAVL